jgi:hypothetical protein
MTSFAERYLLLGIRLGRVQDGLVDCFFGPPELEALVDAEELHGADELRTDAAALRDDVAGSDLDPQRRRWLSAQLEALECVAEQAAGRPVDWVSAVRRCYGVEVAVTPEERFEHAHARLEAALPGRGDLASRLERWNESQVVPPARLLECFDALTEVLRSRTGRLVDLPQGEQIEAELVSGNPWGAYNWYRGRLESRIEINTDLPLASYQLALIAAHEGYPGHHAEHACKEARLVDELGHEEATILLIHTPESLVSEGIAEVALEQGLGEDWPAEVAGILRPLAIPFDPNVARQVVAARDALESVNVNVAYFAHERGWDTEELLSYHRRWALMEPDRAQRMVAFATHPFWSAYTPTYATGRRLVRAYAGRRSGSLRRLLTEQLTTADLVGDA